MGQEGRPPAPDGWLSPREGRRLARPRETTAPAAPNPHVHTDHVSEAIAALRAASAAFERVEASGEQVRRTIERIAMDRQSEQTVEHELVDDEHAHSDDEYAYDDDAFPASRP